MTRFLTFLGVIGLAMPCGACGGEIAFEAGGTELSDQSLPQRDALGPAPAPELDTPPAFFVLDHEQIALSTLPEESWGRGAPSLDVPREDGPLVARRAVQHTRLPAALWGVEGRHVVLYATSGERCTAELGAPALVHRLDPSGDMHFDDEGRPRTLEQIASGARDVWQQGADSSLLVAAYRAVDGDCSNARYAVFADQAAPQVFARQAGELGADVETDLLLAFRALPEYQLIQNEFVEDPASEGVVRWEEHEATAPRIAHFRDAESGRELLAIGHSVGAGCGDFHGALWALFEATTYGLVPRVVRRGDDFPDHVLDLQRDGVLEVFSGSEFVYWNHAGPQSLSVEVPFHGCPC